MRTLYKIIHTASSRNWGQTEQRILNESCWMRDKGHAVIIIVPEDSPLYARAKDQDIPVYPISFSRLKVFTEFKQLKKIFNKEQPYAVNTHYTADSRIALKAAKNAGIPCRIISRHNGARVANNWANRARYKRLSHYVFTDSEDTTRYLQKRFKLKDMEIFSIPNGIKETKARNDLTGKNRKPMIEPESMAGTAEKDNKNHYTIDTMGRDIIRIYRLHQVKREREYYPPYQLVGSDPEDTDMH